MVAARLASRRTMAIRAPVAERLCIANSRAWCVEIADISRAEIRTEINRVHKFSCLPGKTY